MARIRTIKPQFFIDEDISKLKPLTRILFQGLWCLADRAGRLEDKPNQIKVTILPYDKYDVNDGLSELQNSGFIIRYSIDAKAYIQIRTFEKHQHCHIKEPESTIPAPDEHQTSTIPAPVPPVGKEGKGKEGKGKEQECGGAAFALPDWIKADDWTAFEEMRKKIKKPMTDRARENIVKKLAAFKAKGHDPTTVLNNSITGSWQDVYEPKPEGGNGKQCTGNRSFHDRAVEQNKRAKQEARTLLGVCGGGGGLGNQTDKNPTDREGEGSIHGEFEHIPEVETA